MATRTALFFDVFAVDRTQKTFSQIFRSTDTLGSKIVAVGKLAAIGAAAGLAAFAGQGVRSFVQFDDQMTRSLAIMGEVSGPMRKRMETAARQVGKTTRFGAEQAAEAYFFLASAGMDAEQSVAALPQVSRFATAGMFDLATATDLATDAQSALGLAAKNPEQNLRNLTRVTDVLVGANTLANASVEEFSQSLTSKAGPALRSANKEIEEGVAVLAVFADQGIKGQRAGTMLTSTLDGLQRVAITNRDAFERMNISVFDGAGNMRNMADIVGDMEAAFGSMSVEQQRAALMQLGLNRQALDGVMALLGLSDQIRTYEGDLRGMAGVTEEVAGKQLESFAARLDLVKSRATDFGMTIGEVLVNAAFEVGVTVGEMARIFGELPEPLQKGLLAATAIVAAAPLAVGAWRRIRSAVNAVRLAYIAMSATAQVATLSLGAVGIALAIGAGVLAFFARRNLEASGRVDDLRASLDRQTGAITENTREVAAKQLADEGALDAAEQLGLSLKTVTDAALGDAAAMREVEEATRDLTHRQVLAAETVGGTGEKLSDQEEAARLLNDVLGQSQEELEKATRKQQQHVEAVGAGEDAQSGLAGQIGDTNGVIADQVSSLDDLIKSLDDMVSSVFAARDAERSYEQALDDATAALEANGATLDITTEKGRENQKQLDRLAESALKDAAATLEDAEAKGDLAAGHELATEKMEAARKEFIGLARQMGLSKKEAEALADALGLIPGNYKATVTANTNPGRENVEAFKAWIGRQHASVRVNAAPVGSGVVAREHGGTVRRGQTALVGEAGPELVRFGSDARVHPNGDSRRMLQGSGGGVLTIRGDGSARADFIIEELRRSADLSGGLGRLVRI